MNFGGSDILAGIRLAKRIYEYGFAEHNAADVRYMNFQNDVLNFRYLLERLNDSLVKAQERYQRRGPVLGIRAHEPLSADLENERKAIIGNFRATLNDCDELLERNQQFRLRSSTVPENIAYHLRQQEQPVDELRRRLHFHSEKIRFVLDRLSIDLLTDLDAKVDDILAIAEQNLAITQEIQTDLRRTRDPLQGALAGNNPRVAPFPEDVHVASHDLVQRLEYYLQLNAPAGADSEIPLPQGFDALLLHFEHDDGSADHTPEKYLVFLKARWLLERLKLSREYCIARPGFYYKRAINQIEQAILLKTRKPGELLAFDDEILLSLSETCFHIWPAPILTPAVNYRQPHPLMERGMEEKLATIELASNGFTGGDSVTIFKSSEERFRVVLQTTLASNPSDRVVVPLPVNVREDKLIPRYAFPTLRLPSLEVSIHSRHEDTSYQFTTFEDLAKFQTALMGYQVSHHQDGVLCGFSKDTGLNGMSAGHIQLWQEPIVLSSSTNQANGSLSDTSASRHDSLTLSLAPTSTINQTDDGWEADNIKLSSVAFFTQTEDKKQFAVITAELEHDLHVDDRQCGCHRSFESCALVVLKSRKRDTFPLRVVYSGSDRNSQPDPNTFDILPLRIPRPTIKADRGKVDVVQTGRMVFKFKDLNEKQLFLNELNLRFRVRDRQMQIQADFEKTILQRQNRPMRRNQGHLSPNPNSHSGPQRSSSTVSSLATPVSPISQSRHSSFGSPGSMSSSQTTAILGRDSGGIQYAELENTGRGVQPVELASTSVGIVFAELPDNDIGRHRNNFPVANGTPPVVRSPVLEPSPFTPPRSARANEDLLDAELAGHGNHTPNNARHTNSAPPEVRGFAFESERTGPLRDPASAARVNTAQRAAPEFEMQIQTQKKHGAKKKKSIWNVVKSL